MIEVEHLPEFVEEAHAEMRLRPEENDSPELGLAKAIARQLIKSIGFGRARRSVVAVELMKIERAASAPSNEVAFDPLDEKLQQLGLDPIYFPVARACLEVKIHLDDVVKKETLRKIRDCLGATCPHDKTLRKHIEAFRNAARARSKLQVSKAG